VIRQHPVAEIEKVIVDVMKKKAGKIRKCRLRICEEGPKSINQGVHRMRPVRKTWYEFSQSVEESSEITTHRKSIFWVEELRSFEEFEIYYMMSKVRTIIRIIYLLNIENPMSVPGDEEYPTYFSKSWISSYVIQHRKIPPIEVLE
jgi:hypothetical protein